jgi:ABC-2 type transport system ATP-binding protein
VSGVNVAEKPLDVKKKIGYLPELNALYYEMYVREYLYFIAEIHRLPQRKVAVDRAISMVGLAIESKKKIGQLSKGYKQRVGLGAALIHDPEVLILDEPTSGLDPNQIVEIREVIKQQGKDKTVLFSSHILQEVEAICDRVIIINKGELVADDSLSNLQKTSAGKTRILLELKEAIGRETMQLAFGDAVQALNPTTWRFETTEPDQLKKDILAWTIQNNLNVVSIQSEAANLETVFRSLTAG